MCAEEVVHIPRLLLILGKHDSEFAVLNVPLVKFVCELFLEPFNVHADAICLGVS